MTQDDEQLQNAAQNQKHELTEELTKSLGPLDPSAKKALNEGLLQASGEGFKRGVQVASSQVKREIGLIRTRTAISTFDRARLMAEERAEKARGDGLDAVADELTKLAQEYGALTAVIEKEQRKTQ